MESRSEMEKYINAQGQTIMTLVEERERIEQDARHAKKNIYMNSTNCPNKKND